jgi:protein-tyrosine phosphatase
MKILFVCLGNICRSPIAHGLMVEKVNKMNLDWEIDSAGIGGWHHGELPDKRSIAEMKKNGIDITYQRARQINLTNFDYYDYIVVMDRENRKDALRLASNDDHKNKVSMMMNWVEPGKDIEVPDPYYDGRFQLVYDMLVEAIDRMTNQLSQKNLE